MIYNVELSKRAKKDLQKVPTYVAIKMQEWVEDVVERGLEEVRKIPGYHDEPCSGELRGYRSIRLTKGYRAYYQLLINHEIELVCVERVDKHEY